MIRAKVTLPEIDPGGKGRTKSPNDQDKATEELSKVSHPGCRRLYHQSAQSIVEFALVLPILLMLIFGIIEFGRIFQAWLSVQNSARFAVRYAVTGQYNTDYCDDAAAAEAANDVFTKYLTNNISPAINPTTADTWNGDPQDCKVPNSFGSVLAVSAPYATLIGNAQSLAISETIENMTSVLQDYARLQSIRDVTRADAFAISLDPTKTNTDEIGYFRVVVLSSRVAGYCDDLGLAWDDCITTADPSQDKYWSSGPHGFEDAGGPGDSILIGVDFNHPLITPFMVQAWPSLHLTTVRRGIVEVFRASKAVNVAPPLGMPSPTASVTPSITPSPTSTFTLTFTPTLTPTDTLTPSLTYTPSLTPSTTTTASPTITLTPSKTSTASLTPSRTPTRTATLVPSCGNITFSLGLYPRRTDRLRAVIVNNNSVTAGFGTVVITWDSSTGNSNKYVDWINLRGSRIYGGNDWTSTTTYTKNPVINLAGGGALHNLDIDYAPDSRGISGTFTVNVSLKVGTLTCPYSATYSRVGPTPTNTRTPTRTPTASRTPTITRTPTQTLTPSRTPTATRTLTPSRTFTPSRTPTRTATGTRTPTRTATRTALPPTFTYTPTKTRTPTRTATRTNTSTLFPTNTPTATRTPTPTKTPIGGGEG